MLNSQWYYYALNLLACSATSVQNCASLINFLFIIYYESRILVQVYLAYRSNVSIHIVWIYSCLFYLYNYFTYSCTVQCAMHTVWRSPFCQSSKHFLILCFKFIMYINQTLNISKKYFNKTVYLIFGSLTSNCILG